MELPPGAGKTLVGLETARRMLADQSVRRVVVFGPNTAIQGQWLAAAAETGIPASTDRALPVELTALTYQSLAVFDADLEVDDDGTEQSLLARLHDNGRALVSAMQRAGSLLLVLDECHHLLEVWGRLLGQLLGDLPHSRVLGLTATPPDALTREQSALVGELFGVTVYQASLPSVVRQGDLAPFAELAWLVTPSASEAQWLGGEATRFGELVTQLTDPGFGSTPFLSWLDARFLAPGFDWGEVARSSPEVGRAALRLHHCGLLGLPAGARLAEEHRVDPTADDWVLLIDDWLSRALAATGEPEDEAVVAAVRRALPAVGYQWTRRGIRRGRSPVDRVLARSASKTTATVAIVGVEHRNLADRMRMLVLCDHERASATMPVDLAGVIDPQSGSARAVLTALVADPQTAELAPLLVTGSSVAGSPDVIGRLRDFVVSRAPDLADDVVVEPLADGTDLLGGTWRSRTWVPHVTAFFECGGTRVLVGTRGLLGEGWDARWVTGLVDLTSATTTTAVVQTRGRALRVDPGWPDKVALTWSVVCVADQHPRGGNDWDRLVRKHHGFYGVDEQGEVVDGVGHLDPAFSAYAPPDTAIFDAVNARMARRSEDRAEIAALWRVGEPYQDEVSRTLRLLPGPRTPADHLDDLPNVVVQPGGHLTRRVESRPRPGSMEVALTGSGLVGAAGWAAITSAQASAAAPVPATLGVGAVAALAGAAATRGSNLVRYGRGVLDAAARPPGIGQVARAVADGLHACGLVSAGAGSVRVEIEPDASYRCSLSGVPEEESAVFVAALDEALAPIIGRPRYLLPRWTAAGTPRGWWPALCAAYGRVKRPGEAWHPVPSVLGVNAGRARSYARAWQAWVGGGDPVYTGSPEGVGILAAQQGADPFDVTSVMRRHWC